MSLRWMTRALMDDLARQTMIDAQAQRRRKPKRTLAFRTQNPPGHFSARVRAGVAVILTVGAPVAYALQQRARVDRKSYRTPFAGLWRPRCAPIRRAGLPDPNSAQQQPDTGTLPGVPTGWS